MADLLTYKEADEAVRSFRDAYGDDKHCVMILIRARGIRNSLACRGVTDSVIANAGYDDDALVCNFYDFYDKDEQYGEAIDNLAELVQFTAYVKVQFAGLWNMLSIEAVEATGLSKETYVYIIKNYSALAEKYPEVIENENKTC